MVRQGGLRQALKKSGLLSGMDLSSLEDAIDQACRALQEATIRASLAVNLLIRAKLEAGLPNELDLLFVGTGRTADGSKFFQQLIKACWTGVAALDNIDLVKEALEFLLRSRLIGPLPRGASLPPLELPRTNMTRLIEL